jgi:hypothetical protein
MLSCADYPYHVGVVWKEGRSTLRGVAGHRLLFQGGENALQFFYLST